MNRDDFKKILDNALKPIIDTQNKHTESLRTLKEHTKTLAEHTKTLETLKGSVLNIEATNAIYGDMYKINKDDSKKLEKRVVTLEDNAGIESPPELAIV